MDNLTVMSEMIRTLTIDGLMKLDDNRQREDLMGLFTDIRAEIRLKAPGSEKRIYEYAALLQSEIDLYIPQKAYEAGAILGCNPEGPDRDRKRAFMRYVCRTTLDPAAMKICNQVGALYQELYSMLGDTHSLIDEFTELYRSCNGIIHSKIERFFDMGYTQT